MSGQTIPELIQALNEAIAAAVAQGHADEISTWFYVPTEAGTAMFCQFRTELVPIYDLDMADLAPRQIHSGQNRLLPGFAARRASAHRRAPSI